MGNQCFFHGATANEKLLIDTFNAIPDSNLWTMVHLKMCHLTL